MSMRWLIDEVDGIIESSPMTPAPPEEQPQAAPGEVNFSAVRRELRRWEQRATRLRAD